MHTMCALHMGNFGPGSMKTRSRVNGAYCNDGPGIATKAEQQGQRRWQGRRMGRLLQVRRSVWMLMVSQA